MSDTLALFTRSPQILCQERDTARRERDRAERKRDELTVRVAELRLLLQRARALLAAPPDSRSAESEGELVRLIEEALAPRAKREAGAP